METLRTLCAQLLRSAVEEGDNVRCMDDLHYELVPALTALWHSPTRALGDESTNL